MNRNIGIFIAACGLLANMLVVGSAARAQTQAPNAPASKQLFQSDLKGVAGQEALLFVVDFAPGQSLPWHLHPGGHELVYGLEGTLVIEEQSGTKMSVKTGDVKLVNPDVGHTARNESTTAAKVLVVRFKEKDKPVVAPFQH